MDLFGVNLEIKHDSEDLQMLHFFLNVCYHIKKYDLSTKPSSVMLLPVFYTFQGKETTYRVGESICQLHLR